MKKSLVLLSCSTLLICSCGTYTGSGALTGSSLGSVLGSAIGGLAGGPRGSDIGTIVGMAGGAVVGAAVGAQADKANNTYAPERGTRDDSYYSRGRDYERQHDNYNENNGHEDSGYDPSGQGDDVLYDFNGPDYTGDYSASEPGTVTPSVNYNAIGGTTNKPERYPLEIRNARFVDDNQDNRLNPNELCKVIFEIYNKSASPMYDVQPMVMEVSGDKHIQVSGSIHVEKIEPGKGIRYTAMVKSDKRLMTGNAIFRIYAVQGNGNIVSETREFNIPTGK